LDVEGISVNMLCYYVAPRQDESSLPFAPRTIHLHDDEIDCICQTPYKSITVWNR